MLGIYHIVIIITFADLTMIIFIQEHRKNCERHGKYIEAEIAKNRLEELKLHDENRRRVNLLHQYIFQPIYWSVYEQEAWRSKQIKKRIELEEKHMLDFQKLNKDWDKKMNEYESNSEELVDTMKSRHVIRTKRLSKKTP